MSRRSRSVARYAKKFRPLQLEQFETRLLLASLPIAFSDAFEGAQNRVLDVAAPGVLVNDQDADRDPIASELVTDAEHGTVTVNADGSFQYTPDQGYVGVDSFTYRAVTVNPSTEFAIDENQSSVRLDATLSTSFGSDSDDDTSSVSGTLTKRLSPNETPFEEIHITDLDMVLTDGLSLRFRFAFGAAGLNADLPADPSPDPDLAPLRIQMADPGDAAPVVNAEFTQTSNQLLLTGIIDLDATGLANGQIPEGPTPFNVSDAVTDLSGTVGQNGSTITITAPLDFTGSFDASGNTIDVTVTGTIVAVGQAVTEPEFSSPTTVSLNIVDTTPPTVVDVTLNAIFGDPADLPKGEQPTSWADQRSDISSITVTFSEPIQAAFFSDVDIKHLGIDAPNDPDTFINLDPFDVTHNGNTLTIRFPGEPLPEGVYQLEVYTTIRDFVNLRLDGDGDGVGNDNFLYVGNETNRFHRMLADWNGDGGTSVFDFSTFAYWFGIARPSSPSYVDLNNDGGVSVFDFSGFSDNFGFGVVYPVAFSARQLPASQNGPTELGTEIAEIAQVPDEQAANPLVDWESLQRPRLVQQQAGIERFHEDSNEDAFDADALFGDALLEDALLEDVAQIWKF